MADFANIFLGWLHILGVVIWIGGSIVLDVILRPGSIKSMGLTQEQAARLGQAISKRFSPMVWISVVVVAATGVLRGARMDVLGYDALTGTTYGLILSAKLILFLAMMVIGVMIGRTGLKLAKAGDPEESLKAQTKIRKLSEVNIAIGIVVILLAVALRYGGI
ncbi:conserved hypothetical protein [Aeropyrum pernix K1]|uniref:Copper resistance protein D domain-containing protein n=1 Tax=Aeropyrum pernix (strain ATCC 700893 / DSM 11879 / JCM 9820 / NBRC 100138 / K1) TaxID=272557 RepID=Q9YDM2_AERPE|nr:CopD family protein [Aeropyrum pernix]BAA79875.1 conserved hypothetical protein [Aeropyrum pernix K1]